MKYHSLISCEHLIHVSLQGQDILVVLANGTRPDKPCTGNMYSGVWIYISVIIIVTIVLSL